MLQPGDAVPHFEVKTVDGEMFNYATIWQRSNLVLVVLPDGDLNDTYASALIARGGELRERASRWVVTRQDVPGLRGPAVLVADRWGAIAHVATAERATALPAPDELVDWLDFLDRRCPECEGEAR